MRKFSRLWLKALFLLILFTPNGYAIDCVALLHFEGDDESTAFTDDGDYSITYSAVGSAQIDTAQSKFGSASGLSPSGGGRLTGGTGTEQDFGTGDFTIDFWVRFATVASNQGMIGTDNGGGDWINLLWQTDNNLNLGVEGSDYTFSWTPSADTWYHVAITRSGTNLRAFIDGTQIGITETDSNTIANAGSNSYIWREEQVSGAQLNGWMDELRMVGDTAMWTANFTPPTGAYDNTTCDFATAKRRILLVT